MKWNKQKNFNWASLEYAQTREYPWRYFNLIAFVTSTVVLAGLTFINVKAVGYESVSIISTDFAISQRPWWSSLLSGPSRYCDPHIFLQGDTFWTNFSIFEYQIIPVSFTNSSGFAYSSEPLSALCPCEVAQELVVTVDAMQKIVTGTFILGCSVDPNSTSMFMTASYSTFLGIGAFAALDSPIGSDPGNSLKTVLDGLAADLLVNLSLDPSVAFIDIDGILSCPDSPNKTPNTYTGFTSIHHNGSISADSSIPRILNASVSNYFQALSDASYADIGIWSNSSIFVSPDIINATLQPNDVVSAAFARDPSSYAYISYYYYPFPSNSSFAQGLRSDMSPFITNYTTQPSSVISMAYNCHVQQRKHLLNFIISVLVADLSLFATFWAVFTFVASALARSKVSHVDAKFEETENALPGPCYRPVEDSLLCPQSTEILQHQDDH